MNAFAAYFLDCEPCRNHQARRKPQVRRKESAVCIRRVSRVGSERQNAIAEVMARTLAIIMSSVIKTNDYYQMIHVLHLVRGACEKASNRNAFSCQKERADT